MNPRPTQWQYVPVRFICMALAVLVLCFSSQVAKAEQASTPFVGRVGLQMYSLRDLCSTDLEAGLKFTAEQGLRYVEVAEGFCGKTAAEYRALLDKYGLTCIVSPISFGDLSSDEGIDRAIANAQILGARYIHCCWIGHSAPFDEAAVRNAVRVFNHAGERIANAGLKFLYHNHGYEFQPWKDGQTLMDMLIQETDPRFVSFEMDLMWVVFPGADPVALLRKYPTRWELFHLKDLKKGVEGNLSGGTSTENDVVLGTGQVDFPNVLRAAEEIGVRCYIIEDESPKPLDQIPQSLAYLRSLQLPGSYPAISERTHTIAHRGDRTQAPDNTLPSFQLAIDSGIQACEFDVQRTKDGVLVLSHDDNFGNATNGKCTQRIADMTFEEVRKINVCGKFPQYTDVIPPTLDEALELFKHTNCVPVIEIKQADTTEAIADTLKAHDMVGRCMIVSFHHDAVSKIQRLCPGIYAIRNGGSHKGKTDEELVQWFIDTQKDCPYWNANPNVSELNENCVKLLRQNGFQVGVWIVNDAKSMNRWFDMGVQNITSDDPRLLKKIWDERNAKTQK